ncbi:hypothetical protein C8R45DRAFT_1012554 [Mycena sanguinolenta]|nr:hypothetical protein C8R45DRAFT_1012554 [Mycena sanguinolenta]
MRTLVSNPSRNPSQLPSYPLGLWFRPRPTRFLRLRLGAGCRPGRIHRPWSNSCSLENFSQHVRKLVALPHGPRLHPLQPSDDVVLRSSSINSLYPYTHFQFFEPRFAVFTASASGRRRTCCGQISGQQDLEHVVAMCLASRHSRSPRANRARVRTSGGTRAASWLFVAWSLILETFYFFRKDFSNTKKENSCFTSFLRMYVA